jgi:ATP-dependent Clp protease ATP-binding subunit ClpC
MTHSLTSQSRKVLALANEAARSFNHDYVGTEHVLLGLIEERSSGVTEVLETFKIDADKIRAEVERLVMRGPDPVTLKTLPLTPRAKRAIDDAHNQTRLMDEKCIGPEHIFLGLMNEPEGVACQVLLNLGITPVDLRKEVFKVRIEQMRTVEKIVRPVRASTPRKRKMREELLAHLSAIYDQELVRLHTPGAALKAAAERFGNPGELTEQLQAALPFRERMDHFVERWFAWRALESVARYALRQSLITLGILSTVFSLLFIGILLRYGWSDDRWTLVRVLASLTLLAPPTQYVFTFAWIKMRDSLWGVFGSPKSLVRAFFCGAAIAGVVMPSFMAIAWSASWSFRVAIDVFPLAATAGVAAAVATYIAVRVTGPTTIRDTLWAMLDTNAA